AAAPGAWRLLRDDCGRLRLAGRVVGVAARRVVGRVEYLGHLGDFFLDQALDPRLQRDVRGATALAAAAHLQIDAVVLDVDQLDEATVPGHSRVDHRVDQLLHPALEILAHGITSDGYCTRTPGQGQLALGGLRSAE